MYRDFLDDEIIYMIQENADYYEIMLEKYKPLVSNLCKKYLVKFQNLGYEKEDLIQIANIGIIEAVRNYNEDKNTSFYTFLLACLKNKLNTELKSQLTTKKRVLNEAISYNTNILNTNMSLIETLPDKTCLDPFDYLLIEEWEVAYINFLNSLPYEVALIYELRESGFSIQEIAKLLDINPKSVRCHLNVARQRQIA